MGLVDWSPLVADIPKTTTVKVHTVEVDPKVSSSHRSLSAALLMASAGRRSL